MSSATSIKRSRASVDRGEPSSSESEREPSGLQPWQFFLLAGMLGATAAVIVATGQSPASIIILSLTVVATSFVAFGVYRSILPLVTSEAATTPQMVAGRTRAAIEREKTLVLRSIKELEFDFAMGKIAKSDFDEMSARLRTRAIGLMRQLDAGAEYRTLIEQELNARLGGVARDVQPDVARGFSPANENTDFENAGADESESKSHEPDAQLVCASCTGINDPDARFCKHCGSALTNHPPGAGT
jgi:hypothetical protein